MKINELLTEQQLDEINWKKGLATAALAGATALGGAGGMPQAHAYDVSYPASISSDVKEINLNENEIGMIYTLMRIYYYDKRIPNLYSQDNKQKIRDAIETFLNNSKHIEIKSQWNPPLSAKDLLNKIYNEVQKDYEQNDDKIIDGLAKSKIKNIGMITNSIKAMSKFNNF